VHIDTGHNFQEALDFRDALAEKTGEKLIVRNVGDTIRQQNLAEPKGKFASRNALQTFTLLDTINEFKFDCCIGGARRDEEKARAKERIFSVRDEFGQWDPKLQDPNYGTPITEEFTKAKMCVCSRSATGPNWISGTIYAGKTSTCLLSISPMNAKCWNMRDNWWRCLNLFN
jgi:3'-phosphoadenosine 5'-phosphosulfate sulfotransferase (PAPS reductase)/FAD synthetase